MPRRIALLALLLVTASHAAKAQTKANADAAYDGWLKAYLITTPNTFFANSLTDRTEAFMWGQAYMITGVEDAYDENPSADRKQLISTLLDRFEVKNKADLSWDSWNDDTAWATIALIRGYQITGTKSYLSAAAQAWDMAYKRGWDNTYGGGIWENMDNVPNGGKCGLSNWPFVISGALIYLANNDNSYLTRSEAIYAWSRANVFDTTTGRVHEQMGPSGVTGDDNAYNSGLIVNAANSLYGITKNMQYFSDAQLAAKHVIDKYAIMSEDHPANGDFGGDQFYRGLANFARQNDLWSTYATWLQNNATAAWNNRRTDFNVSQNNLTQKTSPTANLRAMEAEGSVVLQMASQTNPISGNQGGAGGAAGGSGAAGSGGVSSGGSAGVAGSNGGSAGALASSDGSAGSAGAASGGAAGAGVGGAALAGAAGAVSASAPNAGALSSEGADAGSNGCSCAAVGSSQRGAGPYGALAALGGLAVVAIRRRRNQSVL